MSTTVKVKSGKKDTPEFREATFEYNLGENLEEALELYGLDTVFGMYRSGMTIAVQAPARNLLQDGKTQEEVVEFMSSWKPGTKVPRAAKAPVDPVAALMADVESGKISPDKIQELMADLTKRLSGTNSSKKR